MSIELTTLAFFGALLFFLVLGLPLTFVLGGVSVIFLYFTWGIDSFYMVASQMWGTMENFTLVAIPLFVFMAMILERTGVANSLYRMMYLWWGGTRGGLAIGTVFICAVFAAMCGISGAAVVAMGTIALPSMLERGYDKHMALGAINIGGGLGILIPPSIIMILYSMITGVSVGQMKTRFGNECSGRTACRSSTDNNAVVVFVHELKQPGAATSCLVPRISRSPFGVPTTDASSHETVVTISSNSTAGSPLQ